MWDVWEGRFCFLYVFPRCGEWAVPGGTAIPGRCVGRLEQAPDFHPPVAKIHLIWCPRVEDISDIKLIRTDTTLDLSQKAEKRCLATRAIYNDHLRLRPRLVAKVKKSSGRGQLIRHVRTALLHTFENSSWSLHYVSGWDSNVCPIHSCQQTRRVYFLFVFWGGWHSHRGVALSHEIGVFLADVHITIETFKTGFVVLLYRRACIFFVSAPL